MKDQNTQAFTGTAKKRQHYIPKFYLEGFVDPHNEPYIWVYEKGNTKIVKASAKDTAVRKHFYSFQESNGTKDSISLENLFAEIEGRVSKIIRKITIQMVLNDEERKWLATFLAFMLTRVPNFRENVDRFLGEMRKQELVLSASNTEYLTSLMKRFETEKGEKLDITVQDYQRFLLSGEFDIKPNHSFSLLMVLEAPKFVPIFYEMNWLFLKSTTDYKFLTSDNPIHYHDPTLDSKSFLGVGLLNKNVEVIFPLHTEIALLATWKGRKGYIQANSTLVKMVNRATIISASKYVFASVKSESLNRIVQKNKDSAPRLVVTHI